MRSLVIKLAKDFGLKVCERPLPVEILQEAEEAFVTNAVIGFIPLRKLERKIFTSSATTKKIRSTLFARSQEFGLPIF